MADENDLTGIPRFNIAKFRAQFRNDQGLTHTSHFLVMITPPNSSIGVDTNTVGESTLSQLSPGQTAITDLVVTGNRYEEIFRDMMYLCDSVQLPGRAINTTQFRSYGQPHTFSQSVWADNTLSISIITRRQLKEREAFLNWQSKAVDFRTGDVGYLDEYKGQVDVLKYDVNGFLEARYAYEYAFPIQVSQEQLSWSANNELLRTNVSFSFRQWKQVPIQIRSEKIFGRLDALDPRNIVGDIGNII